MTRQVDVDFNDLAHDGKARVLLSDIPDVMTGDLVLLSDEVEGMTWDGILAEHDEKFAYFAILPSASSLRTDHVVSVNGSAGHN